MTITLLALLLASILYHWNRINNSAFLEKMYPRALAQEAREKKYREIKNNASLVYQTAIENAKKEYKQSRFTPRMIAKLPALSTKKTT